MLYGRACKYNHERIVQILLQDSGRTPLPNLGDGDTPLHVACKQGNIQLVEMLLDHSPKLALISDTMTDKRHSPLHTVCLENGNKQIVQLILNAIFFILGTEEYSKYFPLDLNIRDANGCTALHHACSSGYNEIVSMLLKFKPMLLNYQPFDVKAISKNCRTPLHVAINHTSTLEVLLDHIKSDQKNSADEIINFLGHPSADTKKHLLEFVQPEMSPTKPYSTTDSCQTSMTVGASCSDTTSSICKVRNTEQLSRKFFAISGCLSIDAPESLYVTKDGAFLSQHKPPNAVDFEEELLTPLAEACALGYSQAVDMLLAAGARDINGMAIRLAQLTKNHVLAYNVIRHHCKLLVRNVSQPSSHGLMLDWSGMKLSEISGDWFTKDSSFHPTNAEDDKSKVVLNASLPIEIEAVKITSIVLKNNNLVSLPAELFQLPNLISLDASYNHLASLTALVSNSLQKINLSNNNLMQLPLSIWYMASLKFIELQNNSLLSLGEEDSIDLKKLSMSLTIVDISFNQLEILPVFMLELPSLEKLNASHNKLTRLPTDLWGCLSLKELNLSNNMLIELPDYQPWSFLMSPLQSDKQISFAAVHCDREVFDAKARQETVFVKHWDRSTILRKKRNLFRYLKAHEKYDFEQYIIYNENCCAVEKINLSRNKLTAIPNSLPCVAPLLSVLDISHNELKEIGISSLPPMIRELQASHNEISKFGNVADCKLKDHMSRHCCMVNSEQQQDCYHRAHTDLKNLYTIDLSHNKLETFQLIKLSGYDEGPVKGEGSEQQHRSPSQLDLLYPQLEYLRLNNNNLKGCFNRNIRFQSQLRGISLGCNLELEALPMEFAYFRKRPDFTQLSWDNLPKLQDPPHKCKGMTLCQLLSYMSSRLKK